MPPTLPAIASANLAWNPRLAHLRCIAAMLVFAFHVFHSFFGLWQPQRSPGGMGWLAEGHTGVSLFFVLSGYLFMSIALNNPGHIDYRAFVRNRLLRIFPLFVLVFMVAISIGRDAFRPQDILYLAFSNLGDAPTSKQFITGAAWTISLEFSFYLVFPFLALFARDQGPRYLLGMIALLLLFKAGAYLVSERPTHMLYSTLLGRFDQFLIGMLAAQLALGQWRTRLEKGLGPAWPGLTIAVLWLALEAQARWASFFLPQPAQPAWLVWPTLEAALWASVILAYTHWRDTLWPWLDTLLERGGELSYSIYLWHGLIIYLALRALGPAPSWSGDWRLDAVVLLTALMAITWPVAALSYRIIEAPFLGLRHAYTNSTKT